MTTRFDPTMAPSFRNLQGPNTSALQAGLKQSGLTFDPSRDTLSARNASMAGLGIGPGGSGVLPGAPAMPDMTLLDASINNISLEGTSLRDQVENIVELGNSPIPVDTYVMPTNFAALPSHSALMGGADIDISGVQLTPLDTVLGDGDMLAPSGVVQGNYGRSTMEDQSAWIYSPEAPDQTGAPELNIAPTERAVPIMEERTIPKANMPDMGGIMSALQSMPAARPMVIKEEVVTPPVTQSDLGGLFSAQSIVSGGVGNSPGRSFGAEAHLYGFGYGSQ